MKHAGKIHSVAQSHDRIRGGFARRVRYHSADGGDDTGRRIRLEQARQHAVRQNRRAAVVDGGDHLVACRFFGVTIGSGPAVGENEPADAAGIFLPQGKLDIASH